MEVELKRLQQEVTSPLASMLVHLHAHKHTNIHVTTCPLHLLLVPLSPLFVQLCQDLISQQVT